MALAGRDRERRKWGRQAVVDLRDLEGRVRSAQSCHREDDERPEIPYDRLIRNRIRSTAEWACR